MADYDNNMRGVLFNNDKGDNPKRPDYTGNCEIDGTKYRLSAWIKQSQKGTSFLSLSLSLDEGKPQSNGGHAMSGAPAPAQQRPALDDEVPF